MKKGELDLMFGNLIDEIVDRGDRARISGPNKSAYKKLEADLIHLYLANNKLLERV